MSSPDEAFDAMMRRTGPQVYALAVRLAGNVADGEDLAQETYTKAYRAWGTFRGDAEASTWLYRICVNTWKNRQRAERRRGLWRIFSLDRRTEDDAPPIDVASPEPPLEQATERQDLAVAVQSALARLPEEERLVLVLREMEGKAYEDIAATLDWPIGTVRSRLFRARARLRDEMKREESPS